MDSIPSESKARRRAGAAIAIGRILLTLALLALLGAWVAEGSGGAFMGLSQQHLFNDAIVLSLLGIASLLDAFWHARHG